MISQSSAMSRVSADAMSHFTQQVPASRTANRMWNRFRSLTRRIAAHRGRVTRRATVVSPELPAPLGHRDRFTTVYRLRSPLDREVAGLTAASPTEPNETARQNVSLQFLRPGASPNRGGAQPW